MNKDRYIEIKNNPDYTVLNFGSEGRYGNAN